MISSAVFSTSTTPTAAHMREHHQHGAQGQLPGQGKGEVFHRCHSLSTQAVARPVDRFDVLGGGAQLCRRAATRRSTIRSSPSKSRLHTFWIRVSRLTVRPCSRSRISRICTSLGPQADGPAVHGDLPPGGIQNDAAIGQLPRTQRLPRLRRRMAWALATRTGKEKGLVI